MRKHVSYSREGYASHLRYLPKVLREHLCNPRCAFLRASVHRRSGPCQHLRGASDTSLRFLGTPADFPLTVARPLAEPLRVLPTLADNVSCCSYRYLARALRLSTRSSNTLRSSSSRCEAFASTASQLTTRIAACNCYITHVPHVEHICSVYIPLKFLLILSVLEGTLGKQSGAATKGDRLSFLAHWNARQRRGVLRRRLRYGEPDAWSGVAVCFRESGRVPGPMSPGGTAVELYLAVKSFVPKRGCDIWQDPARWKGYSRKAALRHLRLGFLNSASPGRSDTRGLSQHDRASLDHNPVRGRCLTCAKGRNQQLVQSVITGTQSTTSKREQKKKRLVS